MPGKSKHTEKFDRCVTEVMAKGHDQSSAYAICTTSFQNSGEPTTAEERELRDISQKQRDKLPDDDFAGPHQSFPIAKPEDVSAAAHSLGRAGGNQDAIKAKIIEIAYRKGGAFVAALPDDWKRKSRAAESGEIRELHLLGATGSVRYEQLNGRKHMVVPIVALMEGVIHPVNAATPEFVPLETLKKMAASFVGRPVMLGHPKRGGKQCSADDPEIRKSAGLGVIMKSEVSGKKLLQEAWLDDERTKQLHPDMHSRLASGEIEEVSVGAFVVATPKEAEFNGKRYRFVWNEGEGDHLAFLPGGRGACSCEMGCGTHRAAGGPGSGNFGHSGRPGEVGGSGGGGGTATGDDPEVAHAKSILGDHSEEADTWIKATLDDNENYFKENSVQKIRKDYEKQTGRKVSLKATDPTERKHVRETNAHYDKIKRLHDQGRHKEAALLKQQGPSPSPYYEGLRRGRYSVGSAAPVHFIAAESIEVLPDLFEMIFTSLEAFLDEETSGQIQQILMDAAAKGMTKECAMCKGLGNLGGNPCEACDGTGEIKTLAGARHSYSDMKMIQQVHDHAAALGATCDRKNLETAAEHKNRPLIKREGTQWILYSKDGVRRLASHSKEADAIEQADAIERVLNKKCG